MLVRPLVIDPGWGKLKSALVSSRQQVKRSIAAFRQVESGAIEEARSTLKALSAEVSEPSIRALVEGQLAKLG